MSIPTRWAIYLRISRTDDRLGVERQLEDCQDQLEIMGADPDDIELYDENNTSATKGLDKRPEYLRMLADLQAGLVGGVMVFLQDRAWRDTDELSAFLKLAKSHGFRFATSSTGEANLNDPHTIANLKTNAVNAELEIKLAGRRIARASRQRARAGKAHGRAPFGWRREVELNAGRVVRSWDVIDEAEAELIRSAARDLLRGIPLRTIVAELNAGDVKPRPYMFTKGRYAGRESVRTWSSLQLRALLLRASNAGLRTFKGEILDGVAAEWPAILDLSTYRRIRVLLADPSRRTNGAGSAPRWLLSGIATCSVCSDGGKINVQTGGTRRPKPAYACVGKPDRKGCLQRHWVDDVDWYVIGLVRDRLADLALVEAAPDTQLEIDELYGRIDEIRTEQATYAGLKAAKKITLAQMLEMNADVDAEVAALEAKISALRPAMADADLPTDWDDVVKRKDLVTMRATIRSLFESIELVPASVNGRYRDPELVDAEVRHVFRGVSQ